MLLLSKWFKYFGLVYVIIMCQSLTALEYSFGVGSSLTQGQTSYDIGISLLEFPVANTLSNTYHASVDFNEKLNVTLHGASAKNLQQSDKFLDSDYHIANDKNSLYIYSESDNDVTHKSFLIDLDYLIKSTPFADYSIGLGYKQQQFDYRIYNVHQWLVGVPNSDQYINDITALTYNSTESIPYISVGMSKNWSSLSIQLDTHYSPIVSYKGYDNHNLRSKHIFFNGKGQHFQFGMNANYTLSSNWSMSMNYQFSYTQTYGDHTQVRYEDTIEGSTGVIGDGTQTTITSLSSVNFSLSYLF